MKNSRRVKRVEPERSVLSGDNAGEANEGIPQRGGHHSTTQRASHNFWNSNAPTVKKIIIDNIKKVSRLKKK